MGLKPFTAETATIPFKPNGVENDITVRGLTLPDFSYLIGEHLADMEAAAVLFDDAKHAIVRTGRLDGFILSMVRDAPGLVAEIISLAADDVEQAKEYLRLPFSVTSVALAEVGRLTLKDAGGLKNLMTSLLTLLSGALPEGFVEAVATYLKNPLFVSPASIGAPEKT